MRVRVCVCVCVRVCVCVCVMCVYVSTYVLMYAHTRQYAYTTGHIHIYIIANDMIVPPNFIINNATSHHTCSEYSLIRCNSFLKNMVD